MGWVSKSHPALVSAIVASFSASREETSMLLSPFTAEDWACTEYWLDTSGLALYFLDIVQTRRLNRAIDPRLLEKLQHKLVDNKLRVARMLREWIDINRSFQNARICYANLKGFTLFPRSCPDSSLRHVSDFDFLVDPANMDLARALLGERGYQLTGSTARSLEFKTAGRIRKSLEGQYETDNRRSAELHIGIESMESADASRRDVRLNRLSMWDCSTGSFPSLDPADQFIGQALHLLGHLRNEHTRVSWLLEYRNHVRSRRRDSAFWHVVKTRSTEQPEIATALGLSTLLATELFGPFAPPELCAWTVDALAPMVRLWAQLYGRRAVLADVPGSKLYLLLEDALREAGLGKSPASTMRKLMPLRRSDRILPVASRATLRERVRGELIELQFLFFRLRFHLKEGFRYLVESRRWKRLCNGRQELSKTASFCSCHQHSK